MTHRIFESAAIGTPTAKGFRVCLIREGSGSTADFPREFFIAENARALEGTLSFPSHPADIHNPVTRNPLDAIGSIGDTVTIEEHDGKMGFWGEYIPAKSKPQIAEYLKEYGTKLGLSVYGDSDGRVDASTGKWIAESLNPEDPYRSVDLVVAAGAGGKFEKIAESLGLLPKTSTPVEEKEVTHMEIKELADKVDAMTTTVGKLAEALEGKAKADLQATVDQDAVEAAVKARLTDYQAKDKLIAEAKLSDTQAADLRALALEGKDITDALANAQKVKTEIAEAMTVEPKDGKIAESFLGSAKGGSDFDPFVSGFGKVA